MIKTDNRFFDDLAKAATGAVGALSGVRQQIQSEIKSQVNRFIIEMDFVPREEFEIVESMAREARLQNEELLKRVVDLETRLGDARPVSAKAAKKTIGKKAPAVKTPAAKKKIS